MNFDFSGKSVLITGGTRGIGYTIAKAFKEHGAGVIITGTSEAFSNECEDFTYFSVDFSKEETLIKFLKRLEEMERIDVCINNAGINKIQPVTELSASDFDLVQHINVRAPFLISKVVSQKMIKHHYGRIVNIGSIWATVTKAGRVAYTTAKTGVVGLTRTLAVELAPHNIMVNTVSPGFTLTELTRNSLSAEEMEKISDQIPIKRMADPSELSGIILYLASEHNTYLTGQNITVDGGFTNV